MAPLLFIIYISDIPSTEYKKCIYADDIAVAVQHPAIRQTEEILSNGLTTLNNYFVKWGLQPNPNKTEVTAFHLNS